MSSENSDQHSDLQKQFAEVFARLPEQDIEQFYAHYQLWLLRRRVPVIEHQIKLLHEHIGENQRLVASLRPSAIALAVLVRLQSSGVSDVEVLDQMLERGEDWLDRMMQRLDYCEQVEDFIQGDYTQWCIRSLEGAYDWIDTVLGLGAPAAEPDVSYTNAPDVNALEATEELLLQKLRLDDEEGALESPLKQPAIPGEADNRDEHEISKQPATAQDEAELSTPEQQLATAAYDQIEVGIAEEFLLARESASETQPGAVEGEEPEELADWKNLESPEARPDPWYSVNLAPDASSNAQPNTMHDWINVLQADAPQAESSTSEVVESSEESLSTPAEDAPQTAGVALTSVETSAEEPVAQTEANDFSELPDGEEIHNEPEMSAEIETTPTVAEVSGEPESIIASHTEEVEEPVTLLVAEESPERTGQDEDALTENADAIPVDNAEVLAAQQEVEIPLAESTAISEEAELTVTPEEAPSLTMLTAENTHVVSGVEIEATEQAGTRNNGEIEAVEQARSEGAGEVEVPGETYVESTVEAEEIEQPGAAEIGEAEQVSLENAIEAEVAEEASTEATVETGAAEETIAENAAEIETVEQPGDRVESSEQALVEDQSAGNGAAPLAHAAEQVFWGYVPVDEALPGEKSQARPWYEYLAQNEQVAQMPQNWGEIEQPVAAEEAQSANPTELFELAVETPELPASAVEQSGSIETEAAQGGNVEAERPELDSEPIEIAVIEGNRAEEAELPESPHMEQGEAETLPAESALQAELEKLERERAEGQGGEMFPEIDATQPMVALKGKQRRREEPRPSEPEVPANTEKEEIPVALIRDEMRSIQHEMQAIQNKVKSIQDGIREVATSPVQSANSETPTAPVPLTPSVPPAAPVEREAPVNGAAPLEHNAASPVEREEPPVKVGFWRRLFGWKRKK